MVYTADVLFVRSYCVPRFLLCDLSPCIFPPPNVQITCTRSGDCLLSTMNRLTIIHFSQPSPLPLIQLIRLLPQRISLKPPKSLLNPLPTLPIPTNNLLSPQRPRQKPRLPSKEQPSRPKKSVRRHVAEGGRFHQRCEVWDGFFATGGEAYGCGLFAGFEGVEEGGAVCSEAVGEEDPEGNA